MMLSEAWKFWLLLGNRIPPKRVGFLSARLRARRAEFLLYHIVRILSIRKLHKFSPAFYPIIVQHYQLTFGVVCDILLVSRGEEYRVYHRNQTQHFAGKSGGWSHWLAFEGSKKNAKNPLTNRPSCDTIRVPRGNDRRDTPVTRESTWGTQRPSEWCWLKRNLRKFLKTP